LGPAKKTVEQQPVSRGRWKVPSSSENKKTDAMQAARVGRRSAKRERPQVGGVAKGGAEGEGTGDFGEEGGESLTLGQSLSIGTGS